jgi:hypothetical protein
MNTQKFSSTTTIPNVALATVAAPASIPPAPQSGVFVTAKASSARPALPCAAFWPGAAAETLRASQVLSVALDELDWLFENTDDECDPTCVQARAAIEGWLSELSPEQQQTIALHFDPTPWPEELPGCEDDSYALAVYQRWPTDTRAVRVQTLEQVVLRAQRRVELVEERGGPGALRRLARSSRWLFEDAARAYAAVRGRVASVVPAASSGFRASLDAEELD